MKKDIKWHENCLENRQKNLNAKVQKIESLTIDLKSQQTLYNFYLAQIELARKENKDSFDPEKYAIKRLCV